MRKTVLVAVVSLFSMVVSGVLVPVGASADPLGRYFYGNTVTGGGSVTSDVTARQLAAVPCASAPDAEWQLSRFTSCWHAGLTYTAYDAKTHAPVGGARFTVAQYTELASNKTDWTERAELTFVDKSAWGVAVGKFMWANWSASCDSACSTTTSAPFPANTPITPGSTRSGSIAFTNPQAKGSADSFRTSYTLQLVLTGSLGDAPVQYSAPPLRCDNQVGNTAGCVVSVFTPTFNVDRIEFPAAAVGVQWAQDNLPSHPGKRGAGEPLHRQANLTIQRANRTRICGQNWAPDSTVPNDSCDEFPFAATREGGSMDGIDCAEIIPHANGTVTVFKPAGSSTCARAHVPLPQNTDVGGDLGQFVQDQRVVDGDAYWVTTR